MPESEIIETERLRLVPFDPPRHLNARYVAWLNDPDVVRFSEQRHKTHTLESCAAFVTCFADSPARLWAIETASDGTHIGNIHADIDVMNGLADVAILIGARDVWGQGYGLEAWNGALGWLKSEPGVRKIVAGCMHANTAMRQIMRNSGMTDDGVRRSHYLLDGKPEDVVFTALYTSA